MASNMIHRQKERYDDDDDDDDDDECVRCPICFRTATEWRTNADHPVDFAYSRTCGHIYCIPCIQQILLAPTFQQRTTTTAAATTARQLREDEPLLTTTQGTCPMCRAELSYFDLMKVFIGETSHHEENSATTTTTTIAITKSEDPVANDPIPPELPNTKFQSPGSHLWFPWNVPAQDITLSVVGLQDIVPGGSLALTTGYRYLTNTHTLQARAQKIATMPDTEFTVWMNFSHDFQFITHGILCRKVVREKSYEHVVGESYPQQRFRTKGSSIWVYPFSATNATRLCRVHVPPRRPPRLLHHPETFWGSVFCQANKIGWASYHFVHEPRATGSDDQGAVAYISYEHQATSNWPPLDNGRPIPSRVYFRNIRCPDPHTFRGSICWYDDYQTTWNGHSRWDYDIQFNSSFACILSGTVHSIRMTPDGENGSATEESTKMSTFGVELNYINPGIYGTIIGLISSGIFHNPSNRQILLESESAVHMTEATDRFIEQIRTDGVTPSTFQYVVYVLNYAVQNILPQLWDHDHRTPYEPSEFPFDLDFYYE
jgi:Zinc finger, C3HC4 type (RING finger)